MASTTEVPIRFRHTNGDIGPHNFNDSITIQQIKEKLVAEWPKEGLLAKDPPTQPADIKLILSGKYVEASKALKEYRKDMGELKPDTIITMHLVIRPSTVPSKQQGAPSTEKESQKGCGCTIQ